MSNLKFAETHNLVAFLEKPKESDGFAGIIDFLNASSIKYALTFWETATAKTLDNGEIKLTATIDGKVKIVTEASVRRHLQLADSDGISSLPTTEIFEQLSLMGPKKTSWEQFSSNIATDINLGVFCYIDVGYLTDADDLKSQTRYVFILNRGVVDWKSIKQSIFATSSTDDRYIAAFDALKEVVWIRKFIFGLGVVLTIEEPINMYCDNTGAIAIVKDHGVTKGARHFRAKVRYL
ncbi:hypothetical protein Tco_0891648 [Tanacetum coccineum]|uniref:Retrotransposon protein n=1 Tax=Tanacetum coccineum TaxID=301880 RepID=A0ABQ5C3J3_9ASTR